MNVVVNKATKTYHTWGRFVRALDGVDLDAGSSQVTLIVGTNGSGKSTLLRVISGALKLDSGQVVIGGSPLTTLSRKAMTRVCAMLQQVPIANLCSTFTVEEMIRLYLDGWGIDDWSLARAAFRRYGIMLNARIREMSGGQQQLVALELVLARRPQILLLDEPTASLDARHSTHILERVAAAAHDGVAVILVSHNIDHGLSICERVFLMHEGRVVGSWVGAAVRTLTASALKTVLVETAASSLDN